MAIGSPPPRASLPLGWIIAFSGFGLLVTIVFVVLMIGGVGRRVARRPAPPIAITAPRIEPMRERLTTPGSPLAQPGETILNASNADIVLQSGNETTFTKTFALDDGAAFLLKNINGSITVGAWDQPKAEVKVMGRGSDGGGQVFFNDSRGSLSLRAAQTRGGTQDVRYEVKLPRQLGRIELESVNGSIKLSDVVGRIVVGSSNGNIELTDVVGVSKVQTVNARITGVLEEATAGPMEFTTVNGTIDLTLKSDFNANLEVTTVHGGIDIDDQFGIRVQKEIVGRRARGKIGSGGQPLKLTTVNGSVKLSKQ